MLNPFCTFEAEQIFDYFITRFSIFTVYILALFMPFVFLFTWYLDSKMIEKF